ncbi:MAG: hypothetical protein GC185_01475 [Alphaproteobacteria bacterium]|nr:hypothetical protein [Alphaproteobacteria bacterium]
MSVRFPLVLAFAAVAVVGVGSEYMYQTSGHEHVIATVTDKDRQITTDSDGHAQSKYIVFTDKEVFENSDSLLRGKFNSSDIQGKLKRDCTYDFEVYGYRNHFFSVYRNIIDATPVKGGCPAPRQPGS